MFSVKAKRKVLMSFNITFLLLVLTRGIMLEKIIVNVCDQMSTILTPDQIFELKNILYMNFHNKKIVDESTSIVPIEQNPNIVKLKMFAATKKVSGISSSSIDKYVYDIKKFMEIVNKPFEEVTSMDIRWYLAYCQEIRKNKPKTVDGVRSALSSFYTFLESEELIGRNPMKKVEKIKVPQSIKKAFSASEMEAIRGACGNSRDRAIIELLYSTGLRVSELCSLSVCDINWDKQEIHVVGKGDKERVVYISDLAIFHLKRYLYDRCKKENCDINVLNEKPLFSRARGNARLMDSGLQYMLRGIGKRALVTDVHPHRFRRTFATDLLNRGMKAEQVMVLMGHSKLETTMIYYDKNKSSIRESFNRCV